MPGLNGPLPGHRPPLPGRSRFLPVQSRCTCIAMPGQTAGPAAGGAPVRGRTPYPGSPGGATPRPPSPPFKFYAASPTVGR
jgi:hypothetical protein